MSLHTVYNCFIQMILSVSICLNWLRWSVLCEVSGGLGTYRSLCWASMGESRNAYGVLKVKSLVKGRLSRLRSGWEMDSTCVHCWY
jgi:hypothetical protein